MRTIGYLIFLGLDRVPRKKWSGSNIKTESKMNRYVDV
jgi:hypothetical protein